MAKEDIKVQRKAAKQAKADAAEIKKLKAQLWGARGKLYAEWEAAVKKVHSHIQCTVCICLCSVVLVRHVLPVRIVPRRGRVTRTARKLAQPQQLKCLKG